MTTPKTCLFVTNTGENDLAVFATIFAKSDIGFLEALADIKDYLHKYHKKVYFYPEITQEQAHGIVHDWAEDYPQYVVTIKKGVI